MCPTQRVNVRHLVVTVQYEVCFLTLITLLHFDAALLQFSVAKLCFDVAITVGDSPYLSSVFIARPTEVRAKMKYGLHQVEVRFLP